MTDLYSLLAHVEKAEGADREIDALLCVALLQPEPVSGDETRRYRMPATNMDSERVEVGHYWYVQRSGMSLHSAKPYTASLDAAVGLVERMSGNWSDISGYKLVVREDSCDVEMWGGPEISCGRQKSWVVERNDRNLALALLAAMLRAVIAKEKT